MIVKNLKSCIAVLLYVGYIITKAKESSVNNVLDTSQNKTVNLGG
jgi:hypothetical protein